MENNKNRSVAPFNKVLYLLFIVFAIYQIFAKHSHIDAAASLGIALAFDPFDTQQPWNERPLWQKIWLFVHLAAVGLLFGLAVGIGDK
ncbi:hypothetical protein [Flavobacterium sp.]|uniref:hypothetical protein n=1 Tax=Flavobacterium sp. TaxID=239 RepID=UPI00391D02CD